ncbi:phospholipid transfer protein C2CD2L [Callorhinchus milii]|uniref:phospholipid transfer protein C2CD2L n=1 Tax=Callorhinchus milii TaxID=7868 RepID=UPI0004573024|nr:phospholipid transfer protein C2CD2L [Callorhinchus milii]|eukprot:gi/632980322/ref/XP_007906970.1/ PREDICTED: C2 domain-containing protein 2-like [Callorhinchus milii]
MVVPWGVFGSSDSLTGFHHMAWIALLLLFVASVITVLTWLLQYSLGIFRRSEQRGDHHHLPPNLGSWTSLLRQENVSEPGLKRLLTSLFAFKSFRDNWQASWIKALNDQACRIGSSLQISFEEGPQLPASATITSLTCTEQSNQSMVLCCHLVVDTIQFAVSITQQSPAAVSMDPYHVVLAPLQAQMEICLEEAEVGGLLVTWCFKEPPALSLTVTPKIQRGRTEGKADVSTIAELIEDTVISTSPAMLLNLKAHGASTLVSGEKFGKRLASPSKAALNAGRGLVVRQLRVSMSKPQEMGVGELCCVLELDGPLQSKRTRPVTPTSSSTGTEAEWSDEVNFEMGARCKQLKVKVLQRAGQREATILGQSAIPVDRSRHSPARRQTFPLFPVSDSDNDDTATSNGFVSLEMVYVGPRESKSSPSLAPLRATITPTKKVEMDRMVMPDGTIVTTVTTIQSRPKMDGKIDSPTRSPSKVEVTEKRSVTVDDSPVNVTASNDHLANGLDPVVETAIRQLTESAKKPTKKTPTKRSTLIISGVSKAPIDQEEMALSVGYAASMDASLQSDPGWTGLPQCSSPKDLDSAKSTDSLHRRQRSSQDLDEAATSDISDRPSVDDVESETGSTGALETRSLKDHKVGFLRSGTKLLFRRRSKQKEAGLSHSHDDLSNPSEGSVGSRKKSGSFSRKIIKRFSFKSKSKASANGNPTATPEN